MCARKAGSGRERERDRYIEGDRDEVERVVAEKRYGNIGKNVQLKERGKKDQERGRR